MLCGPFEARGPDVSQAIQIIRDTLEGRGGARGECHQMQQGKGGRGLGKVPRDIFFLQNFKPYFCILACFFEEKRIVFFGKSKCHVTPVDGGLRQCQQMTHGGRGCLKLAKKVSLII